MTSAATSRSEPGLAPVLAGPPPPLQRGDGVCELAVEDGGSGSRIATLFQRDPCRLLFPRPAPGEPLSGTLIVTSGGLAGGDRLRLRLTAGPGSAVALATQAAEKVYRSLGPDTCVEATVSAAGGAWIEWLPQETILFDGARLRRRTELDLAPGARVLACEMTVLGRLARGERFTHGLFHDAWRVRLGGRLAWADALRLDGDIAAIVADPFGLGGAVAVASVVYAGPEAAALLPAARRLLAAGSVPRAAATVVNGILLARLFDGDAAVLRRALAYYLAGLRHLAGGLPERLPASWQI